MPKVPPLVIALHDNGQIQVTGPTSNKLLCYGLLELAKDVISKQGEKSANGSGIMLVVAGLGRGDN